MEDLAQYEANGGHLLVLNKRHYIDGTTKQWNMYTNI
jgi:hypothetical protein